MMSMSTFRKLNKGFEDLIKINVALNDFKDGMSEVEGALNVELTTESKTTPTSFLVINRKGLYNLLLERG
jgi:hypothetical protein